MCANMGIECSSMCSRKHKHYFPNQTYLLRVSCNTTATCTIPTDHACVCACMFVTWWVRLERKGVRIVSFFLVLFVCYCDNNVMHFTLLHVPPASMATSTIPQDQISAGSAE